VYKHDGEVAELPPSMVGNAGALASLLTLDDDVANGLYASQLVGGATHIGGIVYWGAPDDLYTQEWGWFATALYAGRVPNYWTSVASSAEQNQ
jgi:hypothetical protein